MIKAAVFDFGDLAMKQFWVVGEDGVICSRGRNHWLCHCHNSAHSPSKFHPAKWTNDRDTSIYHFCKHGILGRDDDLPSIVQVDNNSIFKQTKEFAWIQEGISHRENGPQTYIVNRKGPRIESFRYRVLNGGSLKHDEFVRRYEFLWLKPYQYEHKKEYETVKLLWNGPTYITEVEAMKNKNETEL